MVTISNPYHFTSVVDEFLALKEFPAPNGPALRQRLRDRTLAILAHPDIRYMPAFKILDIVAELVNTAADIAAEPQLRQNEAFALLDAHSSDQSPLIRQCLLDAALERARYEPMMLLDAEDSDALAYRNLILSKRWHAMLAVHQSLITLPPEWVHQVSSMVEQAIHDPAFARYRTGPLLQLFAEMLQQARQLHESHATLGTLQEHISPQSALWRSYVLKAARYQQKSAEPTPGRVPTTPLPGRHAIH